MDNPSKLINLIVAILFAILLTVTTTLTVYSRSAVDILSDRDLMREYLVDEEVQEQLIGYIVDKAFSTVTVDIAQKILGEEQYSEIVYNELITNASEFITTETINAVFDWLEGETDAPEVSFDTEDAQENITAPLAKFLDEKLGFLSNFIQVEDLVKENSKIEIIDLSPKAIDRIPQVYQLILKAPQILIFLSFVFIAVILFSVRSWRKSFLLIGISFAFSGLIIIFGSERITYQDVLNSRLVNRTELSLPDPNDLPEFAQNVLESAGKQIAQDSQKYAKFLLAGGVLTVILSQLAIKDVEQSIYPESQGNTEAEPKYDEPEFDPEDVDEENEEMEEEY